MTILTEILAHKRDEVAARRAARPLADVEAAARAAAPTRSFRDALAASERGVRIIAEVKKASPSKGLIRADFDPVTIAQSYELGGAAAISVLTDERWFQGHLDHLTAIRGAVDLPLLRKDFVIDPYQVFEARAAGADAILLILAALDDDALAELAVVAAGLGLDVLWEVHSAAEVERVHRHSPRIVGINNRDLRTFEVDLDVTRRLVSLLPMGALAVSESGFFTSRELTMMREWGAEAFLIGESLMRADDPAIALSRLIAGEDEPRE